jgi:hypothetical protein
LLKAGVYYHVDTRNLETGKRGLAEENLEELTRLTNDELALARAEVRERLTLLEAQIADTNNRLSKLYEVLETGEFHNGELAPRIKALLQRKEELQQAKYETEEALHYKTMDIVESATVGSYVNNLRDLLERAPIIEQRSLFKSFVERIEVCDSEVCIHYIIPMPPSGPAGVNYI